LNICQAAYWAFCFSSKQLYFHIMYIQVRLLNRFSESLWYRLPTDGSNRYKIGTIVQVPLRKQIVPAVILKLFDHKPDVSFAIRKIKSIEPFPCDQHYQSFLEALSNYYCIESIDIIARIRHFLKQEKKAQAAVSVDKRIPCTKLDILLTNEQQAICDVLISYLYKPIYAPSLLHGVTGSGKTEIYKKLIEEVIKNKKSVLLLAPEVSLAIQLEHVLKKCMHDISLVSFHSAATLKQKKMVWDFLLQGQPLLIIGVHLPILLPIANLGLIIVDEEHEAGYQEKKHPKINSKEAALLRASIARIPILLGSATPSISSLYNVAHKGWHFFQLKHRFAGSFPAIKTVLLTENRQRKQFWITRELQNAIQDRLNKKEQIIIFLNRRGYSLFVQCSSCSFIFSCDACSVSLTLHETNILACHYCGLTKTFPTFCPACKAEGKKLIKKGIGTQQVVSILEQMFPIARIGRADLDVSSKKKVWHQTVCDFEEGKIDIFVGTQTISKGFHFPNVTLVGILWADLNLNIPIYNATERALQQLIQVAGRAGRQHGAGSMVIVQAMTNHPVFDYLNELNYLNFYADELTHREDLAYPPYKRFVEIEIKYPDEQIVDYDAQQLALKLVSSIEDQKMNVTLLGPARPPVYKIKHMHMRKIYLKASNMNDIIALYKKEVNSKKSYRSSIFFTPNPLS